MDLKRLNAIVAEKVMGERVIDIPFIPRNVSPKGVLFTDAAEVEWHKAYRACAVRTVPCYSASIEAAWQVVEKMKEDGWHYYVGDTLSDGIYAKFHEFMCDDQGDSGDAYAETAPVAICRAALKAMGVEVPE